MRRKDEDLFQTIKIFLVGDLKSKIEGLDILSIENSTPSNSKNPMPLIKCGQEDIKSVLKIAEQALPEDKRKSDIVQEKLELLKAILSGNVPVPIDFGLEKLITITFKDELYTKFQQFFDNNRKGILVDALRKNVDMKIKSERELVQKDIKLLKGIEKNLVEETKPEKLKEPSSTVVCFDEFSKAIALGGGIKETSSSSHTKEQKAQYYVQQRELGKNVRKCGIRLYRI